LADLVVLAARLKKAEEAYDDMMINGSVRTLVDQNGERVEYSPSNIGRLRGYIMELKIALGRNPGGSTPLQVYL
jgi:hypothetical protein